MGQVACQLTQRIQLLRLLLHARYFADAIQKNAHKPLGKRRNGFEHLWKKRLVVLQAPGWGGGVTQAAISFHAGVGKQACDQPRPAYKESRGSSMLAAHVNLTFEQDGHLGGRVAFAEHNRARFGKDFGAVGGQPLVLRLLQAVERGHFLKGLHQFGNSCRIVRRTVGRGNRG